jgi:hypothetical protein
MAGSGAGVSGHVHGRDGRGDGAAATANTAGGYVYTLANGRYTYTATAANGVYIDGAFTVDGMDRMVALPEIAARAAVTFNYTPTDAVVAVTEDGGVGVAAETSANGTAVYKLYVAKSYHYTVSRAGYDPKSGEILWSGDDRADKDYTVELNR